MQVRGSSGFGLFVFVLLAFAVAMPLMGPVSESAADEAGAVQGTQTRESIMERQKGLGLSGNYDVPQNLPDAFARTGLGAPSGPAPEPEPTGAGVPQLGTRGAASDSDIWRLLRDGAVSAPSSDTASGRLMQVMGDDWRHVRLEIILPYAGWILLGVICIIALFYIVRGQIKIRGGRSGKTIPRFSMSHRIAHWFLACTFILMAISGLIILLGRPLLVPLIGREANAVLASAALQGHNLFGPVFILSLLIVIIRFIKGNFFQWADALWILKGGGLLGGHASSNHYNFGEKTWYWVVVIVGLMMSATGLLLEFPWLTDTLAWHQLSTVLHAGGAILMIAFAMGHIYIGTIGMEGSLDSMLVGDVDENWAKEHHDLWYEEVTGKPAGHDASMPDGGAAPVGEKA